MNCKMRKAKTEWHPYRLEIGISLGLAVMTLAVFGGAIGNDFVNFDDDVYVTENRQIQDGLNAKDIGWAFTSYHGGNWHPLIWLSLQADSQIYGLEPWGYHLTNVLLHTANTILLFWALRILQMRGEERDTRDESAAAQKQSRVDCHHSFLASRSSPFAPLLVAALFGVHPLHVESVAWVAERKDVLSGLFWMLAMLAYIWYTSSPCWTRYLAVAAAMALGLLSKPMLVTLPFVFLLLDYWPLGRWKTGQKTEDREQKTENRKQKTENREQAAEYKRWIGARSVFAHLSSVFCRLSSGAPTRDSVAMRPG